MPRGAVGVCVQGVLVFPYPEEIGGVILGLDYIRVEGIGGFNVSKVNFKRSANAVFPERGRESNETVGGEQRHIAKL